MLSGHQVIRGVLWYRSCSSQGTEVYLFLHGPGHLFSVAFEQWHSSALMISTWAPTQSVGPNANVLIISLTVA